MVNPDGYEITWEGRLIIYEGFCALIILTVNPDGYLMAREGR